jgi:diguanylate cyclase (GGDEF)-like protein
VEIGQRRWTKVLLTEAGLTAVFVPLLGLTMLVAKFFEIPGQSSTWYPPAGVTLAFFVIARRATRWRAFAIAVAARVVFGVMLYGVAIGREVVHSTALLAVFLGASYLIDHIDVSNGDIVHYGRVIAIGSIATPVLASLAGALVHAVLGPSNSFAEVRTFAIGDAIGIATVFPFLTLAHHHLRTSESAVALRPQRSRRTAELAMQAMALVVVPTIAVAIGHDRHAAFWSFAMLPVLWVALRQSMLVASAAVVVGNSMLAWASRLWLGPTDGLVDAQVVLYASTIAAGYVSTVVRLQQRRSEIRLEREREAVVLERTDQLTGLANRSGLLARLRGSPSSQPGRESLTFGHGNALSIVVLDIERFAEVIDGLGNSTGDAVLVSFAQRLTSTVGSKGVVSRLEGDMFAIALPTGLASVASQVATDALAAVSAEPYSEGLGLYLMARAGIASDMAITDPNEVLNNASIALRTAKVGRQRRPVVFEKEQRVQALENRTLLSALRYAIDHAPDQLGLAYQPIYSTRDRSLLGAEALLRWEHPGLGLVSPARFIPLAERSGLMLELGDLVLRKAIDQVGAWKSLIADRPFHLHVNVSPTQLADDQLPIRLARACQEAVISPDRLTLELTESALGLDPHESMAMLERLRSVGARVCLDDFGTGYSTIGWLSRFPIDELKIDQSFVAGLPSRADDVAITKLILGLARDLSLDVTAEGVEDSHQLAALIELGCERAQGYLLSRPIPASDMQALLGSPVMET